MEELLKNPLWLAPMAGVTDRAFRHLCLVHGAGLTYSEMVSAAGLHYDGDRTWELIEPADNEFRLAVQLFGTDPEMMAAQAARVQGRLGERLALIDVNMGCPVRKVVSKGEGSALMKTPDLAARIIDAIAHAVDVPVTAKFRSGWAGEVTAPEFAKRLEAAGASLLAVHGRFSRQMYRGEADWDVISAVKRAVSVPVAGSGDVFSHADAVAMQESCGVDVVMVARGARGNPWIFSGTDPTPAMRLEAMREHLELYLRYEGDEHLQPLRTQFAFYIKGLPGATEVRRALSGASSVGDFERIFARAEERIGE